MKVLITGGAGYIGSVLTQKLLESDFEVDIIDNLMYRQLSLLHLFDKNNKFNFIHKDVKYIKDILHKYDIIIPLAAIVGAPACERNKKLATDINFNQIKNIIDNISKNQKIIMPNTNSQYGSSNNIITEESDFNPLSHYAKTKCDAEKYILDSGNGVCLRLATVFGTSPRMRLDLLVNDFIYKALVDKYIILFQANYKRNYIHIKDIANTFIFTILNYKKMNNNVYNVGLSTANLSKLELAQKIKEYIPQLVINCDEYTKDTDNRNYIVSNKKLESLGWFPLYNLDDGIKELIQSYKLIINYNNKNFTNL